MGCDASGEDLRPGAGGAMNLVEGEMWFEYFDSGMGRGDPITQMMAFVGQVCPKKELEIPAWNARKAAGDGGEFGGGLPQVFIKKDGKQ